MEVQPDFRELLGFFGARRVDFLIVGGYALAFHGVPRFTGDLDLWVRPTPENARRTIQALEDFGFGSLGLEARDFEKPDQVIQLGQPPVRVDLVTSISGVSWDEADASSVHAEFGGVPVRFLGRAALVANKSATNRARDRADLEALGGE